MVTNELSMMTFGKKNGNGRHRVTLWQRRFKKKKCGWSDAINQSEVQIMEEEVQRRLRKLLNWKAPGKEQDHQTSANSLTEYYPQFKIHI